MIGILIDLTFKVVGVAILICACGYIAQLITSNPLGIALITIFLIVGAIKVIS